LPVDQVFTRLPQRSWFVTTILSIAIVQSSGVA
jgi:hypothetical protein